MSDDKEAKLARIAKLERIVALERQLKGDFEKKAKDELEGPNLAQRFETKVAGPIREGITEAIATRNPFSGFYKGVAQARSGKPSITGAEQMARLGVPEKGPISPETVLNVIGNLPGGPAKLIVGGALGMLAARPRATLGYVAENAQNPMSAVPWITSKLSGGAANAITEGARQNEMNQRVKDVKKFGPYVDEQVREAQQLFRGKQISPRLLEQQGRVAGKTVKINPDDFTGINDDLDNLMDQLKNQLRRAEYGQGSYTRAVPTEIEIPAEEALKIRALANKGAQYGRQELGTGFAEAKDRQAVAAGNIIRDKLSRLDPKIEQISQELQPLYALDDEVMKSAAFTPGATAKGTTLDKQSNIANYDKLAGSDLLTMGKRADKAQRMFGQSRAQQTIGSMPQYLLNLAKGYGYRLAGPAASSIEPITPALKFTEKAFSSPYVARPVQLSPWLKLYNEEEK